LAFKVFTAYGAASRPEATFRLSGYLFLSKGILKRAGCEDATHAQLQFDEDDNVLGIRLAESRMDLIEDGYREAIQEKSGIAVNILPLLRFYGFPEAKEIGKRVLPVSFEEGFITIEVGSLRKKATAAAATGGEFDDDIPF
jgi:hypothetical protein